MLILPKLRQLFLIWVILVSFATMSMGYSGGSGTQADPYQIATAEDLVNLGNTTADYDKYFIMTADIDLAGRVFDKAVIAWDTDTDSTFDGVKFTGKFDGGGHVISNLTINGSNYCGLFGYIGSGGSITNFGLAKVNITGTGYYVGCLCGYNYYGTISSSYATGLVSGSSSVGGLCGYNYRGTIGKSYASGIVSGSIYVGGLCGYNSYGTISSSYASGSVSGSSSIGGLCGYNYGTISNSFWDVEVSGIGVAGVIGKTTAQMQTLSTYTDAGWDFVDTDGDGSDWQMFSGWYPVLAWENASFVNIPDVTNLEQNQAIEQLNELGFTVSAKSGYNSELPVGRVCNQSLSGVAKSDYTVIIYISNGVKKYSGGTGMKGAPYKIATADDLVNLGDTTADYSKYFVMTADIDVEGQDFTKAVIASDISTNSGFQGTAFTGKFNGNGHIISNLTINSSSNYYYCGLFGYIGSGGSVANLGLINVNIIGTEDYVGGLCGYNDGTISSSYASGSVSGISSFAGGLCGYNHDGTISGSYATGSVSGSVYIGGLCGNNNYSGTISGSYASGLVSGGGYVGGLCGYNSSGTISNSFWDVDTDGIVGNVSGADNYGAKGKTTAQMQTRGTFTAAGWDFSATDGDVADWQMQAGWYPILAWETVAIVQIPDLTGMTLEQAKVALLGTGLIIGKVEYFYNTSEAGQIFAQSEAAGDRLVRVPGVINICISKGLRYSGGAGTVSDPFLISSADDLIFLGNHTADYNSYFKMAADIDMADAGVFTQAVIAPDTDASTSNFEGLAFKGYFDGDGHVISNLSINGGHYCGLFGSVTTGTVMPEIKNLGMVNVTVTGTGSYVGGLVGSGICKLTNCFATGNVTGASNVGGLLGHFSGQIESCYASIKVVGTGDNAGGLCGRYAGQIYNSYASGLVSGNQYVGGLCGYANSSDCLVTNCYATGSVTGNNYVGGLIGYKYSTVSNCYSVGAVTCSGIYKGGFVGSGSGFTNCFWDKQTSGMSLASGSSTGTVTGVTGLNTADMQKLATFTAAGWDFSATDGDIADWQMPAGWYPALAWETDIQFVQIPDLSGMTLEQAQTALQDLGFVVGTVTNSYSDYTVGLVCDQSPTPNANWRSGIAAKVNLSISQGMKYSGGSGTQAKPYKIATADDLVNLGNNTADYGKYFIMTSNIDMSGMTFNKAVIAWSNKASSYFYGTAFTGNFDGRGHTISNLTISNGGYYGGLFGLIASTGVVSNLNLVNANIATSGYYTGGLCGMSKGYISDCNVRGQIGGYYCVGGLCGFNETPGKIEYCYSVCNVKGTTYVGGLTGYNYSSGANVISISDCYALGSVAGNSYVGGLSGASSNITIKNSYAAARVSGTSYVGGFVGVSPTTMVACFWDTQASNMATGSGAGSQTGLTGLDTNGMQNYTNFVLAGWDFMDSDGDVADWFMMDGHYPMLSWQVIADIDGSGFVDMGDFSLIASNWLNNASESAVGDLDKSGVVDLIDIESFVDYWLSGRVEISSQIGNWTFNEKSGAVASDNSDYNRPGTVYGDPAYGTGVKGGCYVFDGVNDYVSVPGIVNPNAGPFTALLWAKGGGANQNLICQTNGTGTGRIWLGLSSTKVIRTAIMPSGGSSLNGYSVWDTTKWHHVALVWDGVRRHIYVDGYLAVEDGYDIGNLLEYANGPIYIGSHKDLGVGNFWNGMIDDVQIFSKAFSRSEIEELLGHSSEGIIGRWTFDELSGTTVNDSSVYGNSGTAYGSPSVYVTGVDGYCYNFNGIADYVSVPCILSPNAGPFTACLWARGGAGSQNLICQTDGTGTGRIWLGLSDNKIRTAIGGASLISGAAWNSAAWHHVALVWDGAKRHIYIDGVMAVEDSTNISSVEFADGPIYIGAHKGLGVGTFWTGSLDDVRIYNKALSSQEITDLAGY